MRVLLDRDAVVHLIDPENLRFTAVAAELVVLAHDQGLDRLGGTDLGAEGAEAAAREVEIEVVEHLDLLTRLTVAAQGNKVVGTRLRALIAQDAGLSAGSRLGLQPEHAT